ncbi:dihydroxyacetone kinase subunit L [Bacillus sp. SB49]|uniref:dihydroxyacetone kinase subunit DhaL n=1 Tax=Bacillus sp. SB49 TaxID=1071080 RepID=UPI00040A9D14|nr:dihydroxyacetone kinase subunit DhaL [Bacillus sp. SB49]QHT47779.1 dihydroxyacetone kinase subunit L [Bacillus sp. SB49]
MLNVENTIQWMMITNEKYQEQKDYLTSLDRAVGDGDHGINMARGFKEVASALEDGSFSDVSDVLKKAAMTVMSKVGGASGPLYGTAFLKMSTACKGRDVDASVFSEMVQEALEGLKQRGKAEIGEKTMIDVWSPVAEAVKEEGTWEPVKWKEAAETAMEATESLQATKGRASYLKERSVGHLDPGAVSTFYLFEALASVEGAE